MRRRQVLVGVLIFALVLGMTGACVLYLRPVECFNAYTELRLVFSGAETHSVTVAGHRVHYYVMGPSAGPPVVLVHGLGGRSEDWRNLAPYLARAGYRVYLPDLLGYGKSERPREFSYSIADEAKIVVGFCDALELKQVDLGGWSMGGWIVQRVAAEHPERVRRLILLDSAGLFIKPNWNTELFTPITAAELADLDALLMPHPPTVPGFVATDILRTLGKNAWVIHRAMASMMTGRDTTDRLLAQLRMPVMIVWGEVDRITPIAEAEAIHRLIPQSQLEIIPGCGHLAPTMCAAQIGPSLVAFLKAD